MLGLSCDQIKLIDHDYRFSGFNEKKSLHRNTHMSWKFAAGSFGKHLGTSYTVGVYSMKSPIFSVITGIRFLVHVQCLFLAYFIQ